MKPLVSVIIPTFNSASTLEACLRSLKGQAYGNVEIIVVDKFSGDGTREIAERLGTKLFRCNLNKVKARNLGAKKSKGTFLLHADSGMELEKDVIERCVNTSSGADAIFIPETTKGKNFRLNKGIFNYLSHIKLFSRSEIKKELEMVGFEVVKIKPIFLVPATIYSKINNPRAFSVINSSEKILSKVLPSSLFSRSFVVVARKVK